MNKIRKTLSGLDCSTVSSEGFVAVEDDNECTAQIMTDEDISEFVRSSKNINDADSGDENEWNNSALVLTLSNMRNIMKSMLNYLNVHSNGELNSEMDGLEQFVDQF
ncbi:hypothetical protein TNCV_2679431 [Trichonephila clavipes]|nr:hypothetical protein TNCV_2679431 [Trichonephila clavipes]